MDHDLVKSLPPFDPFALRYGIDAANRDNASLSTTVVPYCSPHVGFAHKDGSRPDASRFPLFDFLLHVSLLNFGFGLDRFRLFRRRQIFAPIAVSSGWPLTMKLYVTAANR
jgi:hypothetical protein